MLEKHSIYLSSTPGHHNARHVKKRGRMQRERLSKVFQLGGICRFQEPFRNWFLCPMKSRMCSSPSRERCQKDVAWALNLLKVTAGCQRTCMLWSDRFVTKLPESPGLEDYLRDIREVVRFMRERLNDEDVTPTCTFFRNNGMIAYTKRIAWIWYDEDAGSSSCLVAVSAISRGYGLPTSARLHEPKTPQGQLLKSTAAFLYQMVLSWTLNRSSESGLRSDLKGVLVLAFGCFCWG